MEFVLITPLAVAFWYGVIKWVRYLDTRDLLEGTRPTAAAMARLDARLPKMAGDRR